jgi:CheY-like chemotaxis protein
MVFVFQALMSIKEVESIENYYDPQIALQALPKIQDVKLIIVDREMPRMNVSDFVRAAKAVRPDVEIVVLTSEPFVAEAQMRDCDHLYKGEGFEKRFVEYVRHAVMLPRKPD